MKSFPTPPPLPTTPKERLLILVVEDHSVFSRVVKHALPHHECIFARTIEDGIIMYERHLPDITFLDIDLPDGNGFEFLQHIISLDKHAFIVMLTGSSRKEDVTEAMNYGASGYVLKPVRKDRLDYYIRRYLDQREKDMQQLVHSINEQRPLLTVEKPLPLQTKSNPPAEKPDYSHIRILFVDRFEANCHTLTQAAADLGYNLTLASTCQDAVDIIREENPHIVLIDCELPGQDGYYLSYRIRNYDRMAEHYRIIIGIGQEPSGKENKRWLYAGMNEYHTKPIPTKSLLAIIEKHAKSIGEEYVH